MKSVLVFLGWCLLTLAYGFLALTIVGILFGREAGTSHLIGLAAALVLWLAATVLAGRRRRPPAA